MKEIKAIQYFTYATLVDLAVHAKKTKREWGISFEFLNCSVPF